MGWLKTAIEEIVGLFVDDQAFALAIVAWLALIWFVAARLGPSPWSGVLLFGGLAAILLESAVRRAGK